MGGPIRVLHVVVNMNRGGAETLIMNLYRNIDRSKVQFDFLTNNEGIFDSEIINMGGKIYRIPYISDVGHFNYIKELNRFFLTHSKYQIVHSHMDKMSGFVLRAAKKAGIPVRISHSHSTNSEGNFIIKSYKWYAGKHILPNSTNLLACSHQAAKWLFQKANEKTELIKNGIESNKFRFSQETRAAVRKELNICENSFIIGHVGRFSAPKNHMFLLKIFKSTVKIIPNSVLILVGDGPLLSEIKKKVSEYSLENRVKFLGSRDDVNRLLQAFDLFIFPSLYEGLPVSVIEAQGSGLPCLLSDAITMEVDLGLNLVQFLPLTNFDEWINKIEMVSSQTNNRDFSISIVLKNQGYEISNASTKLQKYYWTALRYSL